MIRPLLELRWVQFSLCPYAVAWKIKRYQPGAQPALHFVGGGQFSWNFIRWRHSAYSTVVQLFRKRSQFTSQLFQNENFSALIKIYTEVSGQSKN